MLSMKSKQTQKLAAIRGKLYLVFFVIAIALLSTRGMVFSYKYPESFDIIAKKVKNNDLSPLTEEEKIFFTIGCMEGQLYNGGFYEYFYDPSSDHILTTLNSLETVGASETKKLLERAINIAFGKAIPQETEKRREILKFLNREQRRGLDMLDRELYESKESPGKMINEYLNR